jgi:hypothetical protein
VSHILTIDLTNLQANADNYKVISFPTRVKVTAMSFAVNAAASGYDSELGRVWKLYAMAGHPTPTPENPYQEWTTQVFENEEAKPILDNATAPFASNIGTPYSNLIALPAGGGVLNLELHRGVFAPGDYMVLWVENTDGDISEITWADTEATINIVYEETAMKTTYEQVQAYPFLD